ncbi:Replication factor A protein 1 [Coemansia sp. RSA 2708]|nr:Replication factor A protein 1 [Coemansia sp. RSA 2708]
MQLSVGELARIKTLENGTQVSTPVTLQVISNIQPFSNQGSSGQMRYRCMGSDGEQSIVMVLPVHLTPLVDEQKICRFTVLRVVRYSFTRKAKPNDAPMPFIIVSDAEVVGTATEKLGNPERSGVGAAATSAMAAPAYQQQHQATPPTPQQVYQQQQATNPAPQQAYQQQQTYQQQQPSFGGSSFMNRVGETKPSGYGSGGAAPVHSGAAPILHPIKDLNPYHNRWTIRARVTQKSGIKSWNKQTSQGRLFSVNLLDDSGEIRATAFTQHVDRLYPMLEAGKVYYISNAQVKMARQQFSTLNNQYELAFDDSTVVEQCAETAGVPQEQYDFVPLANLMRHDKGALVDVLCVVRSADEPVEITPRSGPTDRKMVKRDLTVVDKSGFQVRATLWGQDAQEYALPADAVVAFKGVRVGDFGGRTLSLPSTGAMTANPDIPEAHMLRGWYDSAGRGSAFQTYDAGGAGARAGGEVRTDQLKTMAQVRDENLGGGEGVDYFNVKGTVVFIRSTTLAYPACASADCNKKAVEDAMSGQWRCEKCDRSFAAPEYRYIFSVNVSDATGQSWLQCFNEQGEQLLGCPAGEMVRLQQTDEAQFQRRIADATFREFMFRCRAKSETFNDNTRVRISAVGLQPVDYVAEAHRLNKLIEAFGAM